MADNCPYWSHGRCEPPRFDNFDCSWPTSDFTNCALYKMAVVEQTGGSLQDQLQAADCVPTGAHVAGSRGRVLRSSNDEMEQAFFNSFQEIDLLNPVEKEEQSTETIEAEKDSRIARHYTPAKAWKIAHHMKAYIRRLDGESKLKVGILLFIFIVALVAAVDMYSQHQSRAPYRKLIQNREAVLELASVAEGIGVPAAATFNPANPGTHRLVILANEGELHPWHGGLPVDWLPSSVSEVSLVVVVKEEWVKLDSAVYRGTHGNFTAYRQRHEIVIELWEAKTGKIIESHTMKGSVPKPFPAKLSSDGRYGSELKGSEITEMDFIDWLSQKR